LKGGLELENNIRSEKFRIENLFCEIEQELKKIFGSKLKKIMLYGSYARKSNDQSSDLDIMVLVDMDQEEIKKNHEKVLDVTVDLTTRYGIVLSIIENNYNYFYEWIDVLPFFKNVEREGIELYGR